VDDVIVLCDFDGTITVKDVTDTLLTAFANPEWEEIEEMWQEGLISSKECMARQYALVKASEEELTSFLEGMEIDPYFPQFLDLCRRKNFRVAVLSDGFDFYIEKILSKNNVNGIDIYANHLVYENGKIKTYFPHINEECRTCGNCKTSYFYKVKKPGNKIVYIGDGWSDRCISQESDVIFAKGKLARFCHENGISYIPYHTFGDVIREMTSW